MSRPSLLWRLFPAILAIILASLSAAGAYVYQALDTLYLDRATTDLLVRTRLVAPHMADAARGVALQAQCVIQAADANARVTVIGITGEVWCDSHADPGQMQPLGTRPEVRMALAKGRGSAVRVSTLLGERMLYVAIPQPTPALPDRVLRLATPMRTIEDAVAAFRRQVVGAGALVLLLAAAASFWVARRVGRPLKAIQRSAERLAGGDLSHRVRTDDTEETGQLADALNRMAEQLDERLSRIARQTGEQSAILTGMQEGVLAVDRERRVILLNPWAQRLFGMTAPFAGRPLTEVVRHPEVIRLVTELSTGTGPVEAEISLEAAGRERHLQVRGTPLADADGGPIGSLLVLADVTRLRQLESMRRTFVANVSHELKTPITAIKGSVETLLTGAQDDPEARGRFLDIIRRQTDRLTALVTDTLSLSRIEEEVDHGTDLVPGHVAPVLEGARSACEALQIDRGVAVSIDCPGGLSVPMDAALLEQAVINLVQNAITYSPPGETVTVTATGADEVVIAVADHGPGIDAEHLPRLFERFYRVDASRGREMGGTGLGLAIVKHVALVHGGWVTVESAPGKGSTFRIHLPRP